jgi:hypothetical protein
MRCAAPPHTPSATSLVVSDAAHLHASIAGASAAFERWVRSSAHGDTFTVYVAGTAPGRTAHAFRGPCRRDGERPMCSPRRPHLSVTRAQHSSRRWSGASRAGAAKSTMRIGPQRRQWCSPPVIAPDIRGSSRRPRSPSMTCSSAMRPRRACTTRVRPQLSSVHMTGGCVQAQRTRAAPSPSSQLDAA